MSGSPHTYAFSPYAIPTAFTAAAVFILGLRVLTRRYSRVSVAFFGVSVFISAWQGAFTFMYLAREEAAALLWAKLGYMAVPFIAPAAYQFTAEMLHIAQRRKFAARMGWVVAAQFALLAVTTEYLVTGVTKFWWGFYPRYHNVPSVPYLMFFLGYLSALLFELLRAYPKLTGVERKRIRLLTIAFAIGCVACLDYLPVYGVPLYPMGFVAILIYAGIAGWTLRRYGLAPMTPSLAANEIISTMTDVLFVCDAYGRVQFANDAAKSLLGYVGEEIAGRQLEDFIVPGDEIDTTLRGRSIRDTECLFRKKSGETIELTLSVSPVVEQGVTTGSVMIGRDLRERKQSEGETRRAVTLLQSTLDSTADGILVIGGDGKFLTFNQRFVEMWRIPQEQAENSDADITEYLLAQLIDPAEFKRTLESLHAHPEAESFHLLQFTDGRRFEQYSTGRYVDKSPVRVWSFRDVTARLFAEEALRISEERYRLLFEQNAAGVCVTDFDGRILDCNSTFAEMLGYSTSELEDRNVSEMYDEPASRGQLVARLQGTPTMKGVEVELRRKDGQRVWVLENVSLLGTGENAIIHATVVDITDRKLAEEQIEFHAYHDVLTHLPNRRLFTERLALSIMASKRARVTVAVLFIDLDHFKNVNDTLGHAGADSLLVQMAERLRNCVRQTDTVARLGGDEFTVMLPDLARPEDAAQVAEKILESVAHPLTIAGATVELSASIGIALCPHDGNDVDTLLRNADSAMYRAKEAGRNNYQLCTDQMKKRAVERLSLQSRLRKAISNEQLFLAYQPQVNIASGEIIGAESLVRWNDPERGVVEPGAFIPIAEETRLIIPLGEWAIRTACRQVREWRDAGLPPLRMAVNLSPRQFQQSDLVDMVREAVEEAGIAPELLELEITETTAMSNAETAIEVLRNLRELGVSIAIDDFGSGYSSLAYLQRLPINAVKIDRTFVRGLPSTSGDAAIVGAVLAIARSLELRVIAEGVETKAQLSFLQRQRCDEAQGFFFSRAVDQDSFRALVAAPVRAGRAKK